MTQLRRPELINVVSRTESPLTQFHFQVRELPISPVLQDYIVFYRDPTLPDKRERPVYDEPPPPPRSRIQAILQVNKQLFFVSECYV